MKYHQLLLSILSITAARAAVIPQHGDHASEQMLTSLDNEAAALLNEAVLRTPDQDTVDEPLIDDIEVNDVHGDEDHVEHQDVIYDDVAYTLDEYGRFVPAVTTAVQESEPVDDADLDVVNDPGVHMVVDTVVAGLDDEEGDEIGDEVYIFEDDEDTLDQKLEIDPETGMPFFKNKYDTDFDHQVQWAVHADVDDADFYNDGASQHHAQHQLHPSSLPFCPMDWRILLLAMVAFALVIRLVKSRKMSRGGAISLPTSNNNDHQWRKPPMGRKYHGAAAPRMLSMHGQDFIVTPPARKSPLRDTHPSTTTVVLPIQDDVAIKSIHRNSMGAGGHMRRASAGASHQLMASRQQHARHASMSGIHHL